MTIFDYFLLVWFAYGALALVWGVGKPRKPITPEAASIAVVIQTALIVFLLVSRGVL